MAGFFNTSWDLGNMFSSPSAGQGFTYDSSGMPLLDSGITPRPGSEGPNTTESFTNTWGAPTGYMGQQQGNNIFNPYQANTSGGFYNPYQFGQVQYGTQYGGGQEMPWWMNYNVNNPFMPTQPTPSVQPQQQPQTPRGPQGTGPNGKDLTYDETIKYFGLYDGAENAFAAGDSQAAYRQDHMQWRSGTGAWEGKGKKEGESDLDYPGRTTDAGDVIMGDRQKLAAWSGMLGEIPDNLKALFSGSQDNEILNATPAIGGGSGTTQIPDMFRTGNTNPFNVPYGPQPMSMQNYLDDSQNYSMRNYNSDNVEMALATGQLDPERVEVLSPQDWRLRYPETQRDYNKGFERAENLFNTPSSSNYFQQAGPQSGLPIPQFFPDERLYMRSYTNYPLEDYSADSRFQPMGQFSALDNYKAMLGIQDKFTGQEQVSPYGRTENGMTVPVPLEDINIFSNMRDTSAIDALAAKEAEKKAAADAKAQAEAQAQAQAAAAEKARQAAAAQKRMNDNYETGYVPPNIFTSGTGGSSSGRGSRGSRRR
jgi:hypothetical protein